jgi:hypothetical protein
MIAHRQTPESYLCTLTSKVTTARPKEDEKNKPLSSPVKDGIAAIYFHTVQALFESKDKKCGHGHLVLCFVHESCLFTLPGGSNAS